MQAIVDKWEAFLGKVSARFREIMAEAEPGLDEIIATEVLDPAPVSGALSAVKARVYGLQKKIDESWASIDAQLEGGALRNQLQERGRALSKQIEMELEVFLIHKAAQAARALKVLVDKELGQVPRCSGCGVDLVPPVRHEASTVTCAHCNAVNTLMPGMATLMFYRGSAPHALAQEAALAEWKAQQQAEQAFHDIREPGPADLKRLEAAHVAYWRTSCQAFCQLHPGWGPAEVEREYTGRVGQFYYWARHSNHTLANATWGPA